MVSNHFQQAVAPLGRPWPLRAGTVHPPEFAEALAETFARQVNQVRSMLVQLRTEGIVDVLDVRYHDVLESPATIATRLVAGFDATKAAAAVDPSLRHGRA